MHARDCCRHATARFCADAAARRHRRRRQLRHRRLRCRHRRPSRCRRRRAPSPSPRRPMAPAAPAAGPKLTWGGLVDTYYMYLFNPADGANTLVGRPAAPRSSTRTPTASRCALAAVTLNASMDPVSFQLDLGYGTIGTIINSPTGRAAHAGAAGPSAGAASSSCRRTAPSRCCRQLTLDFGKFYTTAGAEVIPANKNWLYSRSILFNIIPLLHTGARANFKVNDMLSLAGQPGERLERRSRRQRLEDGRPVGRDHRQPDGRPSSPRLHRQGSAPGRGGRARRATCASSPTSSPRSPSATSWA